MDTGGDRDMFFPGNGRKNIYGDQGNTYLFTNNGA